MIFGICMESSSDFCGNVHGTFLPSRFGFTFFGFSPSGMMEASDSEIPCLFGPTYRLDNPSVASKCERRGLRLPKENFSCNTHGAPTVLIIARKIKSPG